MDIKARRLRNLSRLIKEKFADNQSAFAAEAGLKQSYVNDVITQRTDKTGKPKAFGEKVCRKIEAKLVLPAMFLDREDGDAEPVLAKVTRRVERDVPFPLAAWNAIPPPQRAAISKMIQDSAAAYETSEVASAPRGRRLGSEKRKRAR